MSYTTKLQEMGIAASRVDDLSEAMNVLHKAISKLDLQQLRTFSTAFGLIGHLDVFAREEHVRNLAVEMYNCNLRNAVQKIDFDEFPDFSDKLFFLAEQAAEVNIPGAKQLCRSLIDLRKTFDHSHLPFSRMAKWAENIAQVNGIIDADSLKIRITSKYKDAYRHLDEERYIGKVETLHKAERSLDEEHGESGSDLLFVRVTLCDHLDEPVTQDDIRAALRNTYGFHGCSHEHDCCGCISQTVSHMKKLRTNGFYENEIWVVSVGWYRNV